MTSQQIKARSARSFGNSWEEATVEWLKEIAYQLAVQNERFARIEEKGVEQILRKAGFLGDPQQLKRDADSKRGERWCSQCRHDHLSFTGSCGTIIGPNIRCTCQMLAALKALKDIAALANCPNPADDNNALRDIQAIADETIISIEGWDAPPENYQGLTDPQQPKMDATSARGETRRLYGTAQFNDLLEATYAIFWKTNMRDEHRLTIAKRFRELAKGIEDETGLLGSQGAQLSEPVPDDGHQFDGLLPSSLCLKCGMSRQQWLITSAFNGKRGLCQQGAQPSEPVPAESTQTKRETGA